MRDGTAWTVCEAPPDEPALRLAAYRLRHRVFVEEMRNERYGLYEGAHADAHDVRPNTTIFVATSPMGEVSGTLRLCLRKDGPFLADGCYRFEILAKQLGVDFEELLKRTTLVDRGAVLVSHRREGCFSLMMEALLDKCRKQAMLCVVGAIEDGMTQSFGVLSALGFRIYDSSRDGGGRLFHHICLDLQVERNVRASHA